MTRQPSAAALRARAEALRSAATDVASGVSTLETIASQVGDYVKVHGKKRGLKKGMSSKDIFANWDKNGNQHLSKMEFRIAARDSCTVDQRPEPRNGRGNGASTVSS